MDDNNLKFRLMRTVFIILATVFLVQACSPQSTRPESTPANPATRAQQFIARGDYLRAAEEYQQLAQRYPDKTTLYELNAAQAYFDGGDADTAAAILANTNPAALDQSGANQRIILLANIALENKSPQSVFSILNTLKLSNLTQSSLSDYHNIRARGYELQENVISATRERLALSGLLVNSRDKQSNYEMIWVNLNQLDVAALTNIHRASKGELKSWIELVLINQSMLFKPDLLDQELAVWSQKYPDHPAIPSITGRILTAGKQNELRPQHIALCLPLNGQYKPASQAIRNGFLAAWYASANYKPVISVYDADSLNIIDVYRTAVQDGADFIVGPLERQAIGRLLGMEYFPVRVLALNQYGAAEISRSVGIADAGEPTLIQFGLIPEDEARQAAAQAVSDGKTRALIITQDNEFGDRLYQAFRDQWHSRGGMVMGRVSYDQETDDFSTPVKQLLNISNSEQRALSLRQRLNRRIESESRIREDADMIFMAARPEDARQIVPQLNFHRATRIPVYTSSRVFTGIVNSQLDNDLNEVMFTDVPWLLKKQAPEISVLQQSINNNWSADRSPYNRLFAFGIDAFHIIPHIKQLAMQKTVPYPGVTGDLFMNKDGIITRKLLWAKFTDGVPELLDPENMY